MMHETDKDDFYYKDKDGKDAARSHGCRWRNVSPRRCRLLRHDLLRMPASIEKNIGNIGLADLAKQTAGGVSIKPQ